jgi:hypothetical protein
MTPLTPLDAALKRFADVAEARRRRTIAPVRVWKDDTDHTRAESGREFMRETVQAPLFKQPGYSGGRR